MYHHIVKDYNIPYQIGDLVPQNIQELNINSNHNNGEYYNDKPKSFEVSLNDVDRFSTIVYSKYEVNNKNNFKAIGFDDFNKNKYLRKTVSCEPMDKLEKNSSSITFFRDLKDYFNKNLLDRLRNYVNEIYINDLKHFQITAKDYITLTTDELRDRALLLKKHMSSTEVSIVQIYMALAERYKVCETTLVPSIGSLLHDHGLCKACVFANKKSNNCKSGFLCNFCHYNHKLTKSKSSSKSSSISRLSSQTEFFNKLIKTPKSDLERYRSMTTDDGYSLPSSAGSIMSMNDFRSSTKEEFYGYISGNEESSYMKIQPELEY